MIILKRRQKRKSHTDLRLVITVGYRREWWYRCRW